jgi:hypothetical protein
VVAGHPVDAVDGSGESGHLRCSLIGVVPLRAG